MTMPLDELKSELLRLMPVQSRGDWGPQYKKCRWCGCVLEKHFRAHAPDCFAVIHLGQHAENDKA